MNMMNIEYQQERTWLAEEALDGLHKDREA